MADIDPHLHIHDLPDQDKRYDITMRGAYLKAKPGDFTKDWNNMDPVSKGTVVARYDDGEEIAVPADGFLVLPKRDAQIGHEWFFWGGSTSA
jgi:hypothetical protein